jgi:hypothetical protein
MKHRYSLGFIVENATVPQFDRRLYDNESTIYDSGSDSKACLEMGTSSLLAGIESFLRPASKWRPSIEVDHLIRDQTKEFKEPRRALNLQSGIRNLLFLCREAFNRDESRYRRIFLEKSQNWSTTLRRVCRSLGVCYKSRKEY